MEIVEMAQPQPSSDPQLSQPFTISQALTPADIEVVSILFKAYVAWLDLDLTFQNYSNELASLPGKYAPPTGSLLLARSTSTSEAIGCVALRPLNGDGICEMKRLYVSLAGRGLGLGKALAEAVVVKARKLGYRAIRLDTLPTMEAARALYKRLGFREIEPYYISPLEGTIFLELEL